MGTLSELKTCGATVTQSWSNSGLSLANAFGVFSETNPLPVHQHYCDRQKRDRTQSWSNSGLSLANAFGVFSETDPLPVISDRNYRSLALLRAAKPRSHFATSQVNWALMPAPSCKVDQKLLRMRISGYNLTRNSMPSSAKDAVPPQLTS